MRVALFHNRYARRGGEDAAFDLEAELLRKAGCQVHVFCVESAALRGPTATLRAAFGARGSARMAERVAEFLARHPVDVGHVHNFWPLLTPAVHQTLSALGLPVVQTLHNYRLVCARGDFLRAGRPCEECAVRGPWNAVRHGCWRGSRLATAVWADAVAHHRRRGTWHERVDRFVAPSAFARRKLAAAGLPAPRTLVLPNPVADPGEPSPPGQGAVYVGRLAPEKGVRLLLDAWRGMEGVALRIVGDGPDAGALRDLAAGLPNVHFSGELPPDGVRAELARAAFLVAPSLCYESFGLAAAEALAAGRAVVAPEPSALSELIEVGRNGLCFRAGDARGLAEASRALAQDPARCAAMGREARMHFEDHLAPEPRTERLISLYRELLEGESREAAARARY
jgi:glycosyltransferase involved in cell wall biosynthesis